MEAIAIPSIVRAYDSERVPMFGAARLRQIRSRRQSNKLDFVVALSAVCYKRHQNQQLLGLLLYFHLIRILYGHLKIH